MAVKKIEEVYLYYTDLPGTVEKNITALIALDKSSIPFTKMFYNESADFDALINSLNTWWQYPYANLSPLTMDSFPFVVYTEVHDDIPARMSPVKYVSGQEALMFYTGGGDFALVRQ
jgi:hypothetical protein